MVTGTIQALITGKRFGVISSDRDAGNYIFDDSAVVGGTFGELKIGQRVSFDEGVDPCEAGYRRARHIRASIGAME